jgi:glucose-1-phosphatase
MQTKQQIDVILFDLGNVILPFHHFQIAEKLSRFSKSSELKDPSRIFVDLFDFENGLVNLYESGKLSSKQFFESLKERFNLTLSFEAFAPIWNEIFTENEEVSGIIRSLKGKKRLGLLSNTNPLHFDYAVSNFPILKLFDRWILSHEVGFKKPDRAIFEAAIAWAGVESAKILFIDDIKGHVDAALSLGIKALQFVSTRQLREDMLGFDLPSSPF